jgi:CTP:molybdopterin cytidylyltransferase MocA
VAGVLLAAGAGRRMGGPKALLEVGGEPLVIRGIRLLTDAGCVPVVVVVGAGAAEVTARCGPGVLTVEATDWQTGMGASLRAGLTALEDVPVDACVVALVDQPLVTPTVVRRLVEAHEAGAVAAVATYAGLQRNPVLLTRSTWPGVARAAVGDAGARDWLRAHPEIVVAVECSDAGAPDDLDTPADLARLPSTLGRGPR